MDSSDLRALVARVQENVVRVTTAAATADEQRALSTSWDALVARLALGPEPETRACPTCTRTIMRDATLCGHCWTKSVHA